MRRQEYDAYPSYPKGTAQNYRTEANRLLFTDVPYVFVPSKVALARSAGMGRAAIAVSITSNPESDLNGQIQGLKDKVERLMI